MAQRTDEGPSGADPPLVQALCSALHRFATQRSPALGASSIAERTLELLCRVLESGASLVQEEARTLSPTE